MTLHALVPRRSGRSPARSLTPAFGRWDRFFDDVLGTLPVAQAFGDGGFTPRIDVSETDEAVRVVAELPGLEEKDFDLSVEADVLTLKGEKRAESEEDRDGSHYVERTSGSFERSLRLPFEIDPEQVSAAYKHGVLTVTVAKPQEAQPEVRAIPITTG